MLAVGSERRQANAGDAFGAVGVTLEAIYPHFEAASFACKSTELRSSTVIVKANEKANGRGWTHLAGLAAHPKHALLQPLPKPESGLEPLTYRLQAMRRSAGNRPFCLQNGTSPVHAQPADFRPI